MSLLCGPLRDGCRTLRAVCPHGWAAAPGAREVVSRLDAPRPCGCPRALPDPPGPTASLSLLTCSAPLAPTHRPVPLSCTDCPAALLGPGASAGQGPGPTAQNTHGPHRAGPIRPPRPQVWTLQRGVDVVPGVAGLGAWPEGSRVRARRPYSHSLLTKRSSTRLCFWRDLGMGPGCAAPSASDTQMDDLSR